jgi:hypothetical protein
MDVKDAVEMAKATVTDLFAQEGLANLGLEEVEYDDAREQWHITVGFSRPWDQYGALSAASGILGTRRTYKVVVIDKDGKALSVKNRETADAS